MQFYKGTDRFVVLFPTLGIVVKFPIINLWFAICLLWDYVKTGERQLFREIWNYSVEQMPGFKWFLFRGLFANWCEFLFYWQTKNIFLQPTYFSLFGLFNIQKIGKPCLIVDEDLWCQLCELTNREVVNDEHHFSNHCNFCFTDGRLKIIDYGGTKCREIVNQFGEKISEHFNPLYKY